MTMVKSFKKAYSMFCPMVHSFVIPGVNNKLHIDLQNSIRSTSKRNKYETRTKLKDPLKRFSSFTL